MRMVLRFILPAIFLLLPLSFDCIDSLSRAPHEGDFEFTDIDSTTVLRMKVDVDTTNNSVSVYYWYKWNKGDIWIRFGNSDTSYDTTNVWKIKKDTLWDTIFDTIVVGPDTIIEPHPIIDTIIVNTLLLKIIDTFADMNFTSEESLNKAPNYFIAGVTNKYTFDHLPPNRSYFVWIYARKDGVIIDEKRVFRTGRGHP